MSAVRKTVHAVSAFFKNRYSPKQFTNTHIKEEDLMSILEAASTAPSSYNIQPWRFALASKEKFMNVLMEANKDWCKELETFVLICTETTMPEQHGGKAVLNSKAEFDAGTAWGYMTMQASDFGISLHAMGGFDHDAAHKLFKLPVSWKPMCIVAVGYANKAEKLTSREPLSRLIFKAE